MFAQDNWLCTEQSSKIESGALLACGVAEGKDANEARSKAFENARAEFVRICDASDDCKGHKVSVEPKRTTCERADKASYKGYRLLVFNIASETAQQTFDSDKDKVSSTNIVTDAPERITFKEKNEIFKPFVFDSIKNNPRVSKGMSKKDFLVNFGVPKSISESSSLSGQRRLMFFYDGKMCVYSSCYAIIVDDKVESWDDFKPIYTDDLK